MEVDCRKGYYGVLGVNFLSSDDEIRRAYRKLAMQWHPDKWNATPSLVDLAKHKFQQIQQAYSVLSDRRKRILYDAGLSEEEEDEGLSDFVQEMVSLVRKEEKTYSTASHVLGDGTRLVMRFLKKTSQDCNFFAPRDGFDTDQLARV